MVDFIVEDGTGLEDSTSYVTVEFSDYYLGDSWAVDTEAKEQALIVATEYIDARWGRILKGHPLVSEQALEFPRAHLYDRYGRILEGVPQDLMNATCLYARDSISGSLYPVLPSSDPKEIKKKKVTVGPITTETEFVGVASASDWKSYPLADRLMKGFTSTGGRVIRA